MASKPMPQPEEVAHAHYGYSTWASLDEYARIVRTEYAAAMQRAMNAWIVECGQCVAFHDTADDKEPCRCAYCQAREVRRG